MCDELHNTLILDIILPASMFEVLKCDVYTIGILSDERENLDVSVHVCAAPNKHVDLRILRYHGQ
jgi:hypothetical protein